MDRTEYCKNCKVSYCKSKPSIFPFNYSKKESSVYIVLNYPIKKEVDRNVSPIEGFTELDYGNILGGYKSQDSDRMAFLRKLLTGQEKTISHYFISDYKISSLVSCYPNREDLIVIPSDKDISYCSELLIDDIIRSKSKVIVTLGEKAFQSIMEDNTLQLKYNLGKTLIKKLNDEHEVYVIPLLDIFDVPNEIIVNTDPDIYPEETKLESNLKYVLDRFKILEIKHKKDSRLNAEDNREYKRLQEIIFQVRVAMRKIYHISKGTFVDIDKLDISAVRTYKDFKNWVDSNLIPLGKYLIAYDIETNAASQYSEKFDIIGFSLALERKGIYVNLKSLDFEMSEEENKLCKSFLKEVLKNAENIIVHNCLYELPATRYQLDLDIPFKQLTDTLVMVKLMLGGKTGAGLKDNAQKIGYDDWESDLLVYVNNFKSILGVMNLVKYRPVIEKLREGKEIYSYLTKGNSEETVLNADTKEQDNLINLFGEEIAEKGFNVKKNKKSKKIIDFKEEYKEVIQLLEEIVSVLKKYYSKEELPNLLESFSKKILYGIENGLLGNVIPYNWIPSRMLERYGAADAVATYDLKEYYEERFRTESTKEVDLKKGYRYMLMEHYVGYKLMLAGMAWNDKVAQKDYEMYNKISIESLKYLFSNPVLQNYIITNKSELLLPEVLYTYYNDWLWDTYQKNVALIEESGIKTYKLKYINNKGVIAYKHIKHLREETGEFPEDIQKDVNKKMIDLLMSIVDKAVTLDDLKDYFNPSSVKEEVKIVANQILMTPMVKFGNFLTYAKVALMDIEKRQNQLEESDEEEEKQSIMNPLEEQFFKDLKSYLNETDYQNKRIKFNYLFKTYAYSVIRDILSKEEIDKYCKNMMILEFSNEYLKKSIDSMTKKNRGNEKYFGELSSLDDPAQIAVFDSLAMTFINPDDYSTWNDTFKWLLNFRLFKKANKIITSYLEGATGRESVFEVDKSNLESGSDFLIREIPYEEIQPREEHKINSTPILPEDKSLMIHTDFRVSQTATGRWNCLSGDTEIPIITFDKIDELKKLLDLEISSIFTEQSNSDENVNFYSNEDFKLKPGIELLNQFKIVLERFAKITLSTKTLSELEESKEKDFLVYSYDIELDKPVLGFCHLGSQVSGRNVPVFKINLSNNTFLRCTKEHRILMNDNRYKMARDLARGDILKGNISVTEVSYSCVEDKVYDIEVDKYHNFMLANGVIVHNSGFHTLPAVSTIKNLYRSRFRGGVIMQPDFSANEIRCVASFSNETKMLKAFQEGKDIHRANAAAMYHVPYEDVTKAQRRVAKGFSFSILYGSGVKSIAENYFDGDENEAQEQLDNFYKTFPKLKKWMNSKVKEVQNTGEPSETEDGSLTGRVSTLTHRFISIDYNPKDKRSLGSMRRTSVNFPIQSSASTAAAMTFFNIIQNQIERGFKTKPICFIHDSLESDVYPYELFEVIELQDRILHNFAKQTLGLALKADISMGLSMGEECELKELQIYDDKKTKGKLVLSGYKDEILHLIEQWKTVYYKVDYKELEFEEEFVPLSRLFMPKTAFNPYIWNKRYLGKIEIEIEYYDKEGNINPINLGEPRIDSVWDNCPIVDYIGK